ncbi:MAG: zinc ABC transporter substrate-binding protein [Solidesulfovibrio sp.]|uniref:metal ABC transporter solute-binding protein, Zn/Mn family n=1 Tax=Solidesulfovibrio sp. TaxID=2910990 RepID=UPI0031590BFF
MRRLARALCCLILAGACWAPTVPPAAAQRPQAPIVVAAGTTLVSDIVNDLGQGWLTAVPIMPAAACPGHTDLRASDMRALVSARAILLHDWQTHLDAVMGPIRNDPALASKVRVVEAPGNWMVPDRQKAAILAVARLLAAIDPPRAARYAARATARAADVDKVAAALSVRAAPLRGLPVMADVQQKPLLRWFGCDIASQYGRFEESGPQGLAQAVAVARAARVRLVADNLQSSGGSGKTLAEELDAAFVVLSNFPGGFPEAPTWATAVAANLDRCLAALERHGE